MPFWLWIVGGVALVTLITFAVVGVMAMIGTSRAFGRYL